MYEPETYTAQDRMTTREKWQLMGKVFVTVAGLATLAVLGVFWLTLLPLRIAIWREHGRKPLSAGETLAISALATWLVGLWREREHPDEKAYRKGVEQGFTEAARLAGRRAGKAAGRERSKAEYGDIPW